MDEKIREEGEKWVIKQGEEIFIYLFLSPLNKTESKACPGVLKSSLDTFEDKRDKAGRQRELTGDKFEIFDSQLPREANRLFTYNSLQVSP